MSRQRGEGALSRHYNDCQVLACPACGAPVRYRLLRLSDKGDLRYYTDDRLVPSFGGVPRVARCGKCRGYYWRKDAPALGTLERWSPFPFSWRLAPHLEDLDEPAALEAVKALGTDEGKEFVLRVFAWWAGNDPIRDLEEPPTERSGGFRENLSRLADLQARRIHTPYDAVRLAEMHRELGEIGTALEVSAAGEFDERWADYVRFHRDLCAKGDTAVRFVSPWETVDLDNQGNGPGLEAANPWMKGL